MATSRVTAPEAWSATPTVTATVDTALLIENTTNNRLFFWITEDDTPPAVPEGQGHMVLPAWSSARSKPLTLKAGERFWHAIPGGSEDVTLTTGPA